MITAIGILLFVLCVSAHELGHAVQMKKYGVEMKEICLFGLGGYKIEFKTKFFGDTPVTIRPLIPLGAFVRQKDDSIKHLPKSQQVDIYAGGVIVNIYAGLAGLILLTLLKGHFVSMAIVAGVLTAFIFGVRYFKAATIVTVGVAFLSLVAYSLFLDFGSVGGVVTIVKVIASKNSFLGAVNVAAAISLSLGLFNCTPLMGLDGEKIVSLYIPKRVQVLYYILATGGILFILGLAIYNDIAQLF
jgi:membrane-associated protease RseP (regulator of RpoE activity)